MFTTVCPGCEASLNAPDSLKGKKVKCKKCGEPFVAKPAGSVDDEPLRKTAKMKRPTPPTESRKSEHEEPTEEVNKLSAKKRRPADEDDTEVMEAQLVDDDEDEEDAPKPKSQKKKGGGKRKREKKSPVMLFVLIGVGAVLLLGGGAVGAYYAFFNEEKKTDNSQAKGGTTTGSPTGSKGGPATAGITASWVEHHEPDGRYRVKFPVAPQSMMQPVQTPAGQVQVKVNLAGLQAEKEVFISLHQSIAAELKGIPDDQILEKMIEQAKTQAQGATITGTKPVKYQDCNGKELVLTKPGEKGVMVMRVLLAGDRAILLIAGGDNATADSPRIKAFFETLKIE